MPYLKLQTNQKMNDEQYRQLLKHISSFTAELLGKPEDYVQATIEIKPHMIFAGQEIPTAYIELKSIGLDKSKTKELSAKISVFVQNEIAIPQNRVYIVFSDVEREMWGFRGTTF